MFFSPRKINAKLKLDKDVGCTTFNFKVVVSLYIYTYITIPRFYNPLRALVYQPTAGLTSTCQKTAERSSD